MTNLAPVIESKSIEGATMPSIDESMITMGVAILKADEQQRPVEEINPAGVLAPLGPKSEDAAQEESAISSAHQRAIKGTIYARKAARVVQTQNRIASRKPLKSLGTRLEYALMRTSPTYRKIMKPQGLADQIRHRYDSERVQKRIE